MTEMGLIKNKQKIGYENKQKKVISFIKNIELHQISKSKGNREERSMVNFYFRIFDKLVCDIFEEVKRVS